VLPVCFTVSTWREVFNELIFFPLEIIMVSVGYTMPRIVNNILKWGGNERLSIDHIDAIKETILLLFILLLEIIILPFFVALLKKARNNYRRGNIRPCVMSFMPCFLVAITFLFFSLIRGI
jgi:hypothetical protein